MLKKNNEMGWLHLQMLLPVVLIDQPTIAS